MRKIERNLFKLDSLKIILNSYFESVYGIKFLQVNYFFIQSKIIFEVLLTSYVPDKSPIYGKISDLVKILNLDLEYDIHVKAVDKKDYRSHPKYYYSLFYYKYHLEKTPAFTTLNKLDFLNLPEDTLGVYICVKGKRGVRKDRKTFILGSPKRHSSTPGKIKRYKGTIETPMGTMGINVLVTYKTKGDLE